MADEITLDELNQAIEALKVSLASMRDMRARHCCPVRPGMEVKVGRRGTLTLEDGKKVGVAPARVARFLTPKVLVHSICAIDTPPYFRLVVHEQTETGWSDHLVWLEVNP